MVKNCRLSLLAILVLGLACFAEAANAAAWPTLSPEDAKQIMPVSQVKRGMKGYGLTVFQGTKIEKFSVEVLGVLKQMNTGKDLVLVRVGGGPITSRATAVIAGMSGSPCYFKGKLLGAVAYGASFSKEPVGMITPVADMLEAWDTNLPKQPSGLSSISSGGEPMNVDGKSVSSVQIDEPGGDQVGVREGILHMQPLMTPLMVSGISERGLEKLADILRPFHIQPVAGAGGGGEYKGGGNPSLVPGAAIGVSLAKGDIDMTGIGTVTYRRGNKIVAFGHPMLGIGAIDAPMTTAYIADVISSYQVSTKLGTPIKTVGRIFMDRPWSIAGRIGDMPKTIPATITVNDESSKRTKVFHVQVINHPMLSSKLLTMITSEAMFNVHPTPGDSTAEMSYVVNADKIGKIMRSNVFFDPVSIESAATSDLGGLLGLLSSNRFQSLDVKSLNVNVKIMPKRKTATIDRIFVKEGEYEPGETVDVGVVLRPYKQDRITKTYKIKIPATTTDGKIVLQVRGGSMPAMSAMAAIPGMMSASGIAGGEDDAMLGSSGMANADNVNQLVDKFLEREKNNEIVVQLLMRGTTINVAGEKLTGLPSSIADVMKSSRNSGLKMERDEVKEVCKTDMIVNGMARLTLDVKKKTLNEGPSVPKPDAPSAGGSSDASASISMDDGGGSMMGADDMLMSAPASSGKGPGSMVQLADKAKPSVTVSEEKVVPKDDKAAGSAPAVDTTDKTSDKTADSKAPDAAPAPKTDVKSVVRQAQAWVQKSQTDFAKGKFDGVSASSQNKLELASTLKKVAETPEQFAWSLAPANDGVYVGTGNAGKIYHVSDSGQTKLFYETGELEVHSLVRDSKGNVYAGTSPDGKIFKITSDGKGSLLYKAGEKYVLALAVDGQDNVYAGVGDSGKIYKITPDGKASVFAKISEQQILSLHWDVHGSLVAGTGINGVAYRIDKSGRVEPVFDAAEGSITSIVTDGEGNIYAGTSPKGVVYKILPNGTSKTLWTRSSAIMSLVSDAHNNIYAVSDGTLAKIAPDGSVTNLDSGQDKVQYLALAMNDYTGALYASTGNVGSIFVSKVRGTSGTYESVVHDTKAVSKWGRIKWVADAPEGTGVEIRTRTGNVATPDDTWSGWSAPYTKSSGEQIISSQARYIQYQIKMSSTKPEVAPKVGMVSLTYLTPNQPPSVKLTAPLGGEVWAGKETIKWTGSDPDKDTLTYEVSYSSDGGRTWNSLNGKVNAGLSTSGIKPDAKTIISKVTSALEKSPDVPEDMKKQVLQDPDKITAQKQTTPASGGDSASSTATTYSWDTSQVADGTYVVKVVVSDKTSNGPSALTDEIISEPITVCNAAPDLSVSPKTPDVKANTSATITGTAASKLIEVTGVQFRVDSGEWMAATADDGVFDSPQETFTATTPNLTAGTHKVEVQAVDSAGNATSKTVEMKVQ